MCLATIGFYGSNGPFWPLPSTFLTGTAAAAGMALINSGKRLGVTSAGTAGRHRSGFDRDGLTVFRH
jgi:hypothetical protein